MTKRELQKYLRILLEEKIRLLKEIGVETEMLAQVSKEASGDLSSFSVHMADQSSDTYSREITAGLTSEQMRTLRAIDEALKKIHEGDYGVCEKCGCKIQKSRLDFVPYARYCIQCQRSIENG